MKLKRMNEKEIASVYWKKAAQRENNGQSEETHLNRRRQWPTGEKVYQKPFSRARQICVVYCVLSSES